MLCFVSCLTSVDDGHTGTDANRENLQWLLVDVMSGKINRVIVKDLSRLARNYSDAGSYLNPDRASNIIVSITNVVNDNYCYQTSLTTR